MKLSKSELDYFNKQAEELLRSKEVLLMAEFIQHGKVSCLDHSLSVAYYSYWLCQRLKLSVDNQSIIRGALLHDFFLYDWHYKGDRKGLHGFTHPHTALKNAQNLFVLNEKEKDIIAKHMWPLTLKLPKYKEAFVVCLLDKYCSLIEIFRLYPLIIRYASE